MLDETVGTAKLASPRPTSRRRSSTRGRARAGTKAEAAEVAVAPKPGRSP